MTHKLDNDILQTIYKNIPNLIFTDSHKSYNIEIHTKKYWPKINDLIGIKNETEFINYYINPAKKTKISDIYINTPDIDQHFKPFIDMYDMHFVSYSVMQFFERECDKVMHCIKKYNNYTTKIYITWSSKNHTDTDIQELFAKISNIYEWLLSMNPYHKNKNKEIYFVLYPHYKSFYPAKNINYKDYPYLKWIQNSDIIPKNIITPTHMNSGVSWGNKLYVYRYDELYKVFIHELIHNLELDAAGEEPLLHNGVDFFIGKTNKHCFTENKDEYPLIINEAYTEYLTLLLLSYYRCHNGDDPYYECFKIHMEKEVDSSAKLCAKLFDFYNITNLGILLKPNDLQQKTNAFSYIFLKYILLVNLACPNFMVHSKRYDNYCDLINNIRTCSLVDCIRNTIIKELQNINNYKYLLDIKPNNINTLNLTYKQHL